MELKLTRGWGAILALSGECAKAVRVLERAIRLSPMPRSYYFEFLGIAYTGTKSYDKAIAAFKQGLTSDSDNLGICLGLAATYAQMGRPELARKLVDKLANQYPDLSETSLSLMIPFQDRHSTRLLARALRDAGVHCPPP